MESKGFPPLSAAIVGILVGIGLAVGGAFVGNGFYRSRMADRYVRVRGLVERPVKADLGIWKINFTATADDVTQANATIEKDSATVVAFARHQGFVSGEIHPMPSRVQDLWANQYNAHRAPQRYVVTGAVELRSNNVERILAASQKAGDLIQQGVVLSFAQYSAEPNPTYLFTRLNSIRPAMLAQATKSARAVARQFALDSGSRLGGIRQANQGVFQILSADAGESSPGFGQERTIDKKVRLVSTIEYYLVK